MLAKTLCILWVALAHGQIISLDTDTESTSSTETTESETTVYGPISMVVDQLAGLSVDISDRTTSQLQDNIERALSAITGNIQTMSTNAMAELDHVMLEANQMYLTHPECNPAWNLQAFTLNVTRQLGTCTVSLSNVVETYRGDAQQLLSTVRSFVQQMARLPAVCQARQWDVALGPLSLGVDNSNMCFINGMTGINQGFAQAMHGASLLLVRVRQLSQLQLKQAQECSDAVVVQVMGYLSAQRANCS